MSAAVIPKTKEVPEQILDAANRLFAERGYDGTSLQSIAEAVGIRKPSLLYHFSSKEVLRVAVLSRLLEHWNEVLPGILAAANSGEDRFNTLVMEVIAFFQEDTDRARVIYREILDRPVALRDHMRGALGPWLVILADYIRGGQKDGTVLGSVDPESYLANVIQLIVGGLATQNVFGLMIDDEDAAQRQTQEIIRFARHALFTTDYLDKTASSENAE